MGKGQFQRWISFLQSCALHLESLRIVIRIVDQHLGSNYQGSNEEAETSSDNLTGLCSTGSQLRQAQSFGVWLRAFCDILNPTRVWLVSSFKLPKQTFREQNSEFPKSHSLKSQADQQKYSVRGWTRALGLSLQLRDLCVVEGSSLHPCSIRNNYDPCYQNQVSHLKHGAPKEPRKFKSLPSECLDSRKWCLLLRRLAQAN